MGEPLKKVKSGDPLRIPAETFNSFVDAARHHRDNQRSVSADMTDGSPGDSGRTKLKNQSGADRRRFEVLQLGNPLFGPDDNFLEYINHTSFAGLAIAEDGEDRVAILQEPAPSGRIRDAIHDGVSIVRLTGDIDRKRATTREDEFVLVTSEHGPFTVLHDPGPANQERLGVVRFGVAAANETVFFEITSISQAPPDQDCGCAGPGIIFNAQVLYEACGTDAPEQIQVSDLCGAYFEGDPEELIGRRGTAVRMRRKLTGGDPEDCCCWVLITLCPPDEDTSEDDTDFTEFPPTEDTQHQSYSEETEESEFPTDEGSDTQEESEEGTDTEPDPPGTGTEDETGTGDETGDVTGTGDGTGDDTGTGRDTGTGDETDATDESTEPTDGTEDQTEEETGTGESTADETGTGTEIGSDEETGSGTDIGTGEETGSDSEDESGTGTGDGPDPPDTGTGDDGTGDDTGDTGDDETGEPPFTGTGDTDSDGSDSDGTGTGSGTGDGTGDTGEPPTGDDETGSDKSTAIVPAAWSPTGYAALFVAECPEVRFDDVIVVHVPQVDGQVPIDPRYVSVCEPDSLEACGTQADLPVPLGARVEGEYVHLRFAEQRPEQSLRLVIRLTGIRRGFADQRFPTRTARQFAANEKFIRSAYPDE